ncbi:T9SS type A sorting domain-containing protein [Flammeovirga sp. EKP202]|uniref:T9SS type A sorting domain-containing protein n=1 Tax=Flammeovirga sp. EKP202 TaxID=2770592 RepID=UPI00165EF71F|nr:T9SS type A sorting domain-containing protein [Flammeovirga sp. EKP202]MBD0404359.1 T9SS type A sorting domain-containing protein [Flammeovirga sp. EKP202]
MLFTKALNYIKKTVSSQKEWKIYPTLVYEYVTVSTPKKSSNYLIEIMNESGEVLLQKEYKGPTKIYFNKWGKGVYQMALKYDDGELKSKILVYPRFEKV